MTGPTQADEPQTTTPAETPQPTSTAQVPPAGLAAQATDLPESSANGSEPDADKSAEIKSADAKTEDAPKPKRRTRSTARKTRSVELILTISGGPEGEWQADLRHGTERVVQNLTLSATAVAKAARELHPEISGGIETVLDETRRQHRERLEQLESEMRKVKQALVELEDDPDA